MGRQREMFLLLGLILLACVSALQQRDSYPIQQDGVELGDAMRYLENIDSNFYSQVRPRVRRGLNEILKRAELGLAELGDIEHSLEENSRPRWGKRSWRGGNSQRWASPLPKGIDLKMEALKIKRSRQLDGRCKCSPPHGKSIED